MRVGHRFWWGMPRGIHRRTPLERNVGNRRLRVLIMALVVLVGFLVSGLALGQDLADLALVNGQFKTQSDRGDLTGTLVIRDGKVVAIGPVVDVEVPKGITTIDANGWTIVPGLIDCRSTLGLSADSLRQGGTSGNLNVLDGVNPYQEDWREVITQGVTAIYLQPAPTGRLGGRGAVIRVGPSNGTVEDLVIRADASAQASLGIGSSTGNSLLRYRQLDQLKASFKAAKEYAEAWEAYREAQEEDSETDPSSDDRDDSDTPESDEEDSDGDEPTDDTDESEEDAEQDEDTDEKAESEKSESDEKKPVEKPDYDPAKEFLARVVSGDVPLRLEAHRTDALANALALLEDYPEIRLILDGVSRPGALAEQLQGRRFPLVLGPWLLLEDSLPGDLDERNDSWPSTFLATDSRWAFGSFSRIPAGSQMLRFHAAEAVRRGLDRSSILRALTRDAAEIVGAADQLGSIAVGRVADLAAFEGDPLDPSSPTRLVVSQGRLLFHNKGNSEIALVDLDESGPDVKLEKIFPEALPARFVLESTRILGSNGQYAPGQILIEDGRVTAIGTVREVGPEIAQFDLRDAPITPGLVAARTSLGAEANLTSSTDSDGGHIRAIDAFDPDDEILDDYLEAGFLNVVLAPAETSLIAGRSALIQLGANDLIAEAELACLLVLSNEGRSNARYPSSLAEQYRCLDDWMAGRAQSEIRLDLPTPVASALAEQRRQLIRSIVRGETPVILRAEGAAEVGNALRLIESYSLRASLIGVEHPALFADPLASLGVGLIVEPIGVGDSTILRDEIVTLSRRGIPLGFSGSAEAIRRTAALLVAAGLPIESALRGLTSDGVRTAGWQDDGIALQAGRSADLIIWNGSPLNTANEPIARIVAGRLVTVDTP